MIKEVLVGEDTYRYSKFVNGSNKIVYDMVLLLSYTILTQQHHVSMFHAALVGWSGGDIEDNISSWP